ncbi:hypothetical protein FQN55_000516 [Onygenales sp. PD_40]|nr:hypothetical protein FQN55_000516 [Onygenales sp. PD_40]KAK2779537.1 hypothetical protein FQN52_002405 [Onygenales sp. PD_12]KAK2786093.1 hypothetical protein FQN53_007002 [Emmonsiellopsis sp. PD_33]KAK2799199.1 hypothetical protein FQN51_007029 [Onygenales sp. PD_10]
MPGWKPPAFGSPCWLSIPATNVPRAKSFYETVFNWSWTTVEKYSEDDFAFFKFPEEAHASIGGSIEKVDAAVHTKGKNGVKLYFIVEDQEKTAEAIVKNGGVKLGEPEPEGDHGFITPFEDSEGNHMGIYASKKA